MNETEQELLRTLVELDEAVARMATANPKPNLLLIFDRLDTLMRALPPEADPSLKHYLAKKSYAKARKFLEGRDPENQRGQCAHM